MASLDTFCKRNLLNIALENYDTVPPSVDVATPAKLVAR